MMAKRIAVSTGRVMTEGDELYYEVRGQGQPLLMIAGAGGDAGFYAMVADILADEYQVITYDRRGNSRSTRNDPQNFEISQQARDAVAVLRAAGHDEPALVFGNSGGAVIALEMAVRHARAVRGIVVHEPPVLRVLPDSEKRRRYVAGLYRTAFSVGYKWAMLIFGRSIAIGRRTYAKVPNGLATRLDQNFDFFVKHEMLPFTNYKPDVALIKQNGVKVCMAAGKQTLAAKRYYGRTAPILAELLGCRMVPFPGNHLSYLDRPQEWAATLRGVLKDPAFA